MRKKARKLSELRREVGRALEITNIELPAAPPGSDSETDRTELRKVMFSKILLELLEYDYED